MAECLMTEIVNHWVLTAMGAGRNRGEKTSYEEFIYLAYVGASTRSIIKSLLRVTRSLHPLNHYQLNVPK